MRWPTAEHASDLADDDLAEIVWEKTERSVARGEAGHLREPGSVLTDRHATAVERARSYERSLAHIMRALALGPGRDNVAQLLELLNEQRTSTTSPGLRLPATASSLAEAQWVADLAALLPTLPLGCLDGLGPTDRFEIALRPLDAVWRLLFATASMGGMYSDGAHGAYGRFAAWQSLAGLTGAPMGRRRGRGGTTRPAQHVVPLRGRRGVVPQRDLRLRPRLPLTGPAEPGDPRRDGHRLTPPDAGSRPRAGAGQGISRCSFAAATAPARVSTPSLA
ncbi:DUF6183 family protein [Streptomyces noursei]|uniref:DUF6183 family protein n=1 Tax=Streptomyces noursei TaxID=1971 RepID=UPI0030F2871F